MIRPVILSRPAKTAVGLRMRSAFAGWAAIRAARAGAARAATFDNLLTDRIFCYESPLPPEDGGCGLTRQSQRKKGSGATVTPAAAPHHWLLRARKRATLSRLPQVLIVHQRRVLFR